MKVRFYTNAAMQIDASESVKILCDPWFTPGAFDGSWWQWPPLKTTPEDLTDYTYIYISHIHQDHCDPGTLRRLRNKDVPVIILKKGDDKFLKERIKSFGLHNFIELRSGESVTLLDDVVVTMYEAFTPNIFFPDTTTPNIIDSSIVVKSRGGTIFNANDNIPRPEDCRRIVERHGPIDIAMLPYGGVGPFPSSYRNLDEGKKRFHADLKTIKYLNAFIAYAKALNPGIVVPCAGQMILGGRNSHRNPVLGMADVSEAKALLDENNIRSVVMSECDTLSIVRSPDGNNDFVYERSDVVVAQSKIDKGKYIEEISREKYWWETAVQIPVEYRAPLAPRLSTARSRMWRYQERFGFTDCNWRLGITVEDEPEYTYSFFLNENAGVRKIRTDDFLSGDHILQAIVPYDYLVMILICHCHWNNAYHGCLVDWFRKPDEFIPDIQTLMSYFHL